MLGALSRSFFHVLGESKTLQRLALRYGMRHPASFARRFIAGETVEEALVAVHKLEARGMMSTLDHVGEGARTTAESDAATRVYLQIIGKILLAEIDRNLSLKLTQIGLDVDRATCVDNLRRILDAATTGKFFVRIDMENSPYTQVTLDIFETIWEQGYRNVGIALQSYLKRSEDDCRRFSRLGARIRLIKGAYEEPKTIAYRKKSDVDAAFVRMMRLLLEEGTYPAIATHDVAMIDATRAFAAERGIARDRFEFQMLYGIRRDLQASLVAEGYRFRVYVPFGRQWHPYFMRRLGERPANVFFVLRSLIMEDLF